MVFLGLQKDRELYNASLSPPLMWSHSVIKSSLMVLFFRVSAFWSLFFYNKFFCRSNCLNHWSMKPHRADPWSFLFISLSLISQTIHYVYSRHLINVCRMNDFHVNLEITHSLQLREFPVWKEHVYKQWKYRKICKCQWKSRRGKKSSWGSWKRPSKINRKVEFAIKSTWGNSRGRYYNIWWPGI